jgi:hypothetical protein
MHGIRFTKTKFFFNFTGFCRSVNLICQRRKIIFLFIKRIFLIALLSTFSSPGSLQARRALVRDKNSSLTQGDFLLEGKISGISDSPAFRIESVKISSS